MITTATAVTNPRSRARLKTTSMNPNRKKPNKNEIRPACSVMTVATLKPIISASSPWAQAVQRRRLDAGVMSTGTSRSIGHHGPTSKYCVIQMATVARKRSLGYSTGIVRHESFGDIARSVRGFPAKPQSASRHLMLSRWLAI